MKVLSFHGYEKGSLQGFVELCLDSGLVIRGMSYHRKEDQRWLGFPSRPYEDEAGQTKYSNIVYIADDATWKKFQKKALEALDFYFASNQADDDDDNDFPF